MILRRKGVLCRKNPVARLMRTNGIVALQKRKWHPTTAQRQPDVAAAPNRLNQEFTSAAPNLGWVSDYTFIVNFRT